MTWFKLNIKQMYEIFVRRIMTRWCHICPFFNTNATFGVYILFVSKMGLGIFIDFLVQTYDCQIERTNNIEKWMKFFPRTLCWGYRDDKKFLRLFLATLVEKYAIYVLYLYSSVYGNFTQFFFELVAPSVYFQT